MLRRGCGGVEVRELRDEGAAAGLPSPGDEDDAKEKPAEHVDGGTQVLAVDLENRSWGSPRHAFGIFLIGKPGMVNEDVAASPHLCDRRPVAPRAGHVDTQGGELARHPVLHAAAGTTADLLVKLGCVPQRAPASGAVAVVQNAAQHTDKHGLGARDLRDQQCPLHRRQKGFAVDCLGVLHQVAEEPGVIGRQLSKDGPGVFEGGPHRSVQQAGHQLERVTGLRRDSTRVKLIESILHTLLVHVRELAQLSGQTFPYVRLYCLRRQGVVGDTRR